MKEDYLWDKSGTDAEIEKMENTLAQFRYQETPAPVIIQEKVLTVEAKPKYRFFNFSHAFSFASCAAFVLILLGVWFYNADKILEIGNELAKEITPEVKINLPEKRDFIEPDREIKTSQPPERPAFTKAKFSSKKPISLKAKPFKRNDKKQAVKLTEEEQYAYDQLMLALSITSSKLNLVKEKVAFLESPNLSVKQESQ